MAQVNKTRTAAELQNPDLNYFIAYRINVNETDVSKIEDALKKQRNTFASNQTNINNRLVELINNVCPIKDMKAYKQYTGPLFFIHMFK